MKNFLFLFFIILNFIACSEKVEIHVINGKTMGTTYTVKIVDRVKANRLRELKRAIDKRLVDINQSMSTYIPDSELNRLNNTKANINFSLSKDLAKVLKAAWFIAEKTKGAFDPTVGALVNIWGFGPDRKKREAPKSETIRALLKKIGYQNLVWIDEKTVMKKNDELYVDLSAIAKGFGVDEVSLLLLNEGFKRTMVEIGGEVKVQGLNQKSKPWRLGVESPKKNGSILRVAELLNMAIASSGNYRNFYISEGRKYAHTIDPRTGYPVTHQTLGSTAISESCMESDAWATALMVMGEEALSLAQENGVATLVIDDVKGVIRIKTSSQMESFLAPLRN